MPCYTSRIYDIEFKADNYSVLEKAAKALGWSLRKDASGVVHVKTQEGYISITGGKAVYNNAVLADNANRLRVEYGRQAINTVCQKLGWTKTPAGNNKFLLSKGV